MLCIKIHLEENVFFYDRTIISHTSSLCLSFFFFQHVHFPDKVQDTQLKFEFQINNNLCSYNISFLFDKSDKFKVFSYYSSIHSSVYLTSSHQMTVMIIYDDRLTESE